MNKNNRTEFEYINNNKTKVEGHMKYYIEYANKMLYPSEVRVGSDEYTGKYLSVKSQKFLGGDEYSYFVEFDYRGLFKKGYSYFSHKCRSDVTDQNEFKKVIKKEINKLNVIHGTAVKLLFR